MCIMKLSWKNPNQNQGSVDYFIASIGSVPHHQQYDMQTIIDAHFRAYIYRSILQSILH